MGTQLLAERIELLEGTLDPAAKTVGVVLIRPGWSANGRYYSQDVLAKAAPLFEGVKAYANHPTREQLRKGESRSVLDITGDYTNVHIGEGGELRATRHVYGSAGDAVWPLIERSLETKRPIIGVSINALGKAAKGKASDGKEGMIIESIEVANSADDVDTPAAGGGFEQLIMGDNSLITDLLHTLSYEELVEARPDVVDAIKKQNKRVRQTEEIRALTEERDAAQTALTEAQTHCETLTAQADKDRATIARLQQQVALEKALREANFNHAYEQLLRERLSKTASSEWLSVVAEERAKLRAVGVTPPPVPVHGSPLREARQIALVEQPVTGEIDMTIFDTPEKLQAELLRRSQARVR